MTFLGLERPVEYGREQVFDPTTAQMVLNANRDYINAVYNDYRQALADMKEFNKEYGDFLSPIQADMDWYEKNVSGRIRGFIDDLYSRGIDPLRSSEGRAAVTRELARLPIQQVAQKRQAAESAREYIKNRDALRKAGMWNEDYERAMLGGQLLEEWDNSLGPWKATSASPYMDYEQKYGHLFDKMGFEYDPEESKKFPGMRAFTKSKDRMRDILSASRPDLINDPQYKYDLQRIMSANPGISSTDASRLLENEIIERNYKGGMELKEDPIYMANLKYKQNLDLLNRRLAGKTGNGSGSNESSNQNIEFMDELQDNVNRHVREKSIGRDSVVDNISDIADYWNQMAKKVENKGRIIDIKEYEDQITTPMAVQAYPSPLGGGLQNSTKTIKRKENTYDQSQNGEYNKAIYERNRWMEFKNTGRYYISKYDKSDVAKELRTYLANKPQYDKKIEELTDKVNKYGMQSLTEKEQKYVTKYYQRETQLAQYKQNDMQSSWLKAKGNSPEYLGKGNQSKGTTSITDMKRRSSALWNTFAVEDMTDHQLEVLRNQFAGQSKEVSDPDMPNKYREIKMTTNYNYAPIRQSRIAGSGRFKHDQIENKFNRWLHSDGVFLKLFDDNNLYASIIPTEKIGGELDILQRPIITKEQFMEFYNESGASKYGSPEDVAKRLGLGVHKKPLTYKGKDETLHETDTYYSVPVIKTLGPSAYGGINIASNKLLYGSSEAAKRSQDSQNQGFMSQEDLEEAIDMIYD